MMQHNFSSYIDLRQDVRESQSDESFWPGFTDIMTVILMIFMFTMITVVLKNADLALKLKGTAASLEAFRHDLSESKKREEELKIKLIEFDEKLTSSRMEIILLQDENKLAKSSLEGKLAIISALQEDVKKEREKLSQREAELESKNAEIAEINHQHDEELQRISEETKRKIEEFNEKFAKLTSLLQAKDKEIIIARDRQNELELDLAKQRNKFTLLEQKYNRLFRPARSREGKVVVVVRLMKKDGVLKITIKDVDGKGFVPYSKEEMEKKLTALKKRFGRKLYVKVSIPKESQLSYNEAWSLTNALLTRYDYYYQQENLPEKEKDEVKQ